MARAGGGGGGAAAMAGAEAAGRGRTILILLVPESGTRVTEPTPGPEAAAMAGAEAVGRGRSTLILLVPESGTCSTATSEDTDGDGGKVLLLGRESSPSSYPSHSLFLFAASTRTSPTPEPACSAVSRQAPVLPPASLPSVVLSSSALCFISVSCKAKRKVK